MNGTEKVGWGEIPEELEQRLFEEMMWRETEEFADAYPDVREFPQEVLDEIASSGSSAKNAYAAYLLRQKEQELEKREEAVANAEKKLKNARQERSPTRILTRLYRQSD